jgi:hypothetical protein
LPVPLAEPAAIALVALVPPRVPAATPPGPSGVVFIAEGSSAVEPGRTARAISGEPGMDWTIDWAPPTRAEAPPESTSEKGTRGAVGRGVVSTVTTSGRTGGVDEMVLSMSGVSSGWAPSGAV